MRSTISLTICSFGLFASIAYGQGNPHKVQGSGSSPQAIKFVIDHEYCSDRSDSPYLYNDASNEKVKTLTTEEEKKAVAGVTVSSPIPDLRNFVDPGGEIISATQTSLMSDGSDASRLLTRTFFAGPCSKQQRIKSTAPVPEKLLSATYYVINIVTWKHSSAPGKSWYQVESSEWYVFNTSDKSVVQQTPFHAFHPTVSSDDRIYGSKAVGFLAIHLKPSDTEPKEFGAFHISYNVNIKEKQPINVQDLIALVDVVTSKAGITAGQAPPVTFDPKMIGLYGGGLVGPIAKLPDDITFEANVEFPGGSAAVSNAGLELFRPNEDRYSYRPVKFVIPTLGIYHVEHDRFRAANAADSTNPKTADSNAKSSAACDTTIDPATHKQAPCSFSKTYDDEGLYHWDVSVGVPVKALNELQYSSTDGSVTGKNVSRLNAYGLFDIYPVATDLKSPPAFGWPHFIVGLPFSGKVFNKPFFGSGGVVNFQQIPKIGPALSKIVPVKFNFYGGVVYNKEFRPATLTVGAPASPGAVANNLVPHRVWKGQFGIEFSIRDVKDKLTAAKKSTATGSDSTKASSTPKPGSN